MGIVSKVTMSVVGGEALDHGCLGHEERKELEKFMETRLRDRTVRKVNQEGSVTILNGPDYKKWTLREVKEDFKNSKEWEKVKTSFYCIPSLEKREFQGKKIMELKLKKKYDNFLAENTDSRAEELMLADRELKQFEQILTNETELILHNHIRQSMTGEPGVLFRSVQTDDIVSQMKMKNLSEFSNLGIEVPVYNCKIPEHERISEHTDECYRSENDFILFYVDGDKLCIRPIEVKRPNTTFYATQKKLPSSQMVKKCLDQLQKALDFILAIIPEIPTENLDIKLFSAFPETPCANAAIFCNDCQRSIISEEDVESMKNCPQILREKLNIPSDPASDTGLDLLLTVVSRIVGKASLLHRGNRDLSDPFTIEKQNLDQNFEKIEKEFLNIPPFTQGNQMMGNN